MVSSGTSTKNWSFMNCTNVRGFLALLRAWIKSGAPLGGDELTNGRVARKLESLSFFAEFL